jgi:two-component system NtrC family sensor kinase
LTPDDATKAESRQIMEDLERKLAESVTQQAATSDILRVISQSPTDVRPVFDAIVLNAVRLFRCDLAFFLRRHGNTFSQAALVGSDGSHIPLDPAALPIDPEINFPSRTIVSKKNLHLPDWSAIDLPEHERRIHETYGINSSLFLPLLLRGGECFGLLALASKRSRIFGKSEISLAESFRDQAVIAIENVRLFEQVQAKTRDLSESLQQQTATADVLKVISRSVFDLQTVLDTLVESAYRLCGASLGLLYLKGEEAFECKAIAGAGVDVASPYFKGRPIRAGRATSAERVIMTGEVQSVTDFFSDPYFDPKALEIIRNAASAGSNLGLLRSTLGVPMMRDGAVVGVLVIASSQTGPFPQRQIELLQTFADQAVIAIENARLFDEVQAKTRDLTEALTYQTGSSNILSVIASSPTDVGPVLRAIVESACELCEAVDAIVQLMDGDSLRSSAHHGPIPLDMERWPISRKWVSGRAFLEQKPVHVRDLLSAEGDEFPETRQRTPRTGTRSILSVPLLREGKSLGTIVLRRTEVHPFGDKQIALLQTFADQAVIAIENVRLFDEVQARTDDLRESLQQQTATADVLQVISRAAFDLNPVFETVAESSVKLCGSERALIFRFDGEMLRVCAAFNAPHHLMEWLERNPVRPGRHSVAARAALERRTIHVQDVRADQEHTYGAKDVEPFRTVLGVPMLKGNDLRGVILVYHNEVRPFTEKQIALVETFADQAVIAIENARLFEQVQEKTADLTESLEQQTATSQVLQVISSTPGELEPVFKSMLENATRICGANFGQMNLYADGRYRPVALYNMPPAYAASLAHGPPFQPHPQRWGNRPAQLVDS